MKFEEFLNEKKKITLKRVYTEKYPEITVGMSASVRNKIIEAISDGKLTKEEFNSLVSELSGDSKRWLRRNAKYFNVSEDGVVLSKFGKRVLRSVSINENSDVVFESTRSQIGIIDRRGVIHSTYVHSDGYPDGVGQMAKDHFSDTKKMKELLKLGKNGISYLEPGIEGGEGHSFDSPVEGQTVFYGRDRGETRFDMTQKRKLEDLDDYLQDVANDGAEYVYLWDEKEKEWKYAVAKTKDGRQSGLQVLESELIEDIVEEGRNAFITAARAAKAKGLKEFEFKGKTFPVTVKDISEEEGSIEEEPNKILNKNKEEMNEKVNYSNKRGANKVSNKISKIFMDLPIFLEDKNLHLAAIKYLFTLAMEDANFSREASTVANKIPRGKFSTVAIPVTEIGGLPVKVSESMLKASLDPWYSQISEAAGWAGDAIVEGTAQYLETLGYSKEAEAMVMTFNQYFESKLVPSSFDVFSSMLNEQKELEKFEIIEEAFSSKLLRDAFTNTNRWSNEKSVDARLARAFYQSAKIALDKVQDEDISIMDPADAYKLEKKGSNRTKTVTIYVSDRQKDNPYDDYLPTQKDIRDGYKTQAQQIPGNGFILAVTDGNNNFLGVAGWGGADGLKKTSKSRYKSVDSYGISKQYKGYGSYGLYNVKRISEVADRALVFNIDALQLKYSTFDVTTARKESKKGAAAFKSDKEFRKENQNRYYEILKQRATETDVDAIVQEIIEIMNNAVSAGLAAGETGNWGNIMVPGTKYSIGEASRVTSNTLDKYERYIDYKKKVAEWEKETGGKAEAGSSYYEEEAASYAKKINDIYKSVKSEYAV